MPKVTYRDGAVLILHKALHVIATETVKYTEH